VAPKLDFVRGVPYVRSLTLRFLIHPCATPPPPCRRRTRSIPILSFLPVRSPDHRARAHARLSNGVSAFSSSFRVEIPVSPETLDDVATLLRVPRRYAYFTDFYGIPPRLLSVSYAALPPSPPLSLSLSLSAPFSITNACLFLLHSLRSFILASLFVSLSPFYAPCYTHISLTGSFLAFLVPFAYAARVYLFIVAVSSEIPRGI